MANTLTDLVPKILTEAAIIYRNNSITANLVNRGFDTEFRRKGDTINVPSFTAPSVQDITPGRGNENTPSNIVASNVSVTLDKWKEVKIQFTDLELKKIEDGRPSEALEKAIISLVDYVDADILSNMAVKGYSTAGTAGAAFSDPATLVDARTKMSAKNVPMRMRSAAINPTVAGAFIKDTNLSDSSQFGGSEVLRDAVIGRLYGYDIVETNNLTDFVGGTLSNGTSKAATVTGANAVGVNSIAMSDTTLTGTVVEGDVFTIAGDTQEYVVTATATAATNAITVAFEPALQVATSGTEVVTFVVNYTAAGLAFQEDAYIFGSAPVQIDFTGGNMVESFTDPVSGITFTYEVERVNKNTEHSLSILYGGEALKREGIVRLLS